MAWPVWSGVMLTLASLMILTGCGGATTDSDTSETVTLIVWDEVTGAAGDAAERVYADFSEAFPEIRIERRLIADEEEPADLRTALASGTGPDVLGYVVDTEHYLLFEQGLLAPLNLIPARYGWSQQLDPVARQWLTKDNRLFGLPVGIEFSGLYVNTTLAEGLGEDPPRTYASLLDLCALAAPQGFSAMALSDDGANGSPQLFGMVLNNLLGPDLTAALLFAEWSRWDTSRVARASRIIASEMPAAGCATPADVVPSEEEAIARFGAGQTLLLPGSSGQWAEIAASAPFETTFISFPNIDNGQGRVIPTRVVAAYGLAAKSAYPRQAARFLNYLLSEEAAQVWAGVGGLTPAVESDPTTWNLPPLNETMLDLAEAARRPFGPDLGYRLDPGLPVPFEGAIAESLQAVQLGEASPAQVASQLERLWQSRDPP